ncbi:MAG: replication-associated recombination protein A [Pseudomonadota bacterium]
MHNLPKEDSSPHRPLADRLRPQYLSEVVGQAHVLGSEGMLTRLLKEGHVPSLIFWGPPGCGKTTIARILSRENGSLFASVSAVASGAVELRSLFRQAQKAHQAGKKTVLLVDEIHRFNRAQQDLFLPYIEEGSIILIGATTENPSFELNGALLSRCRVVVLKRLESDGLEELLKKAEQLKESVLPLTTDARQTICAMADGDGRHLLNLCEELFALEQTELLDTPKLLQLFERRRPIYDKGQDGHYNLISALHKSMRGSDVQASLYWLARMLVAGEDPLFIIRRLVRFASEDVGLADPNALQQSLLAKEAYHFLGSPEGELAIVQAVIYLATAPKSNSAYVAMKQAFQTARKSGSLMPPKHILNAPTQLMQKQDYGKGYVYDHDTPLGFSGQNYFPEELESLEFYGSSTFQVELDVKPIGS